MQKRTLYAAGKFAALALIVLIIVRMAASDRVSRTGFSAMTDAVTADFQTDHVLEGQAQMVRRLYGLDPSAYDGVLLYYPGTNMDCEELFLVKLKSTDQQDEVRAAIESRKSTQLDNFNGYGTYQYGMLQQSVTEIDGNYCLFVCADNADTIKQDFLRAL